MSAHQSYQVAVIGSGAGGRAAALLAAREGLRVVVVEKDALGGTSCHRGYYPMRALRACAEALKESSQSHRFGFDTSQAPPHLDHWHYVRQRVSGRLAQELGDQLRRAAIDIRFGSGSLVNANTIRVENMHGETEFLNTDYLVLATGSRPDFNSQTLETKFVNSDQLLRWTTLPRRLLIVGGGYIGCEFASIFCALGTTVTLFEKRERLLPDWDESIGDYIATKLRSSGVQMHLGQELEWQYPGENSGEPVFGTASGVVEPSDLVLIATGRRPNTDNLGLEQVEIKADPFVRVDDSLRTSLANVFAVGDVNGLGLLDSVAVAQAQTVVDTIRGKQSRFTQRWVPRCVHTDPPVASVGWTEEEAGRAGFPVIAHSETLRLITDDEKSVIDPIPLMLKILVEAESREILGIHAIGRQAAEVVNTAALAIRSGTTIDELNQTTFIHPSTAEAIQQCSAKLGPIRAG
jgi:dihydrolipoamide dehydrogenase